MGPFDRWRSGRRCPGVAVEASSDVLIEKVRSAISDGAGQYRIVDPRPSTYTVTFTLGGVTTARRGGVELAGSFTASIKAKRPAEGDHCRYVRYADCGRSEFQAPAGVRAIDQAADGQCWLVGVPVALGTPTR